MAYSVLFTVSLISAWVLRDHGAGLMSRISWVAREVKGDPLGQHEQFYGAQAVYRVSIGSALFFLLNAAALYKVKLRSDPRDKWIHHGSWFIKLPLWILCCVLPFRVCCSQICVHSNGSVGKTWRSVRMWSLVVPRSYSRAQLRSSANFCSVKPSSSMTPVMSMKHEPLIRSRHRTLIYHIT